MKRSVILLGVLMIGCASPHQDYPPAPTTRPAAGEESFLRDIRQLTSGFTRAGEAYFSPDMNWIIFQATPPGEKQYQMFVARLRRKGDRIIRIDSPVRITPAGSASTCGYFAPDGRSLIFASTSSMKHATTAPATAPGYQRATGTYRWEFPPEMEILRADSWGDRIRVVARQMKRAREIPGNTEEYVTSLRLVTRPLTDNLAYDAECAFSPDGGSIVFASNRSGDVELYVMRADGSDTVQLTRAKGYDGGPFFSPDGKRLVYRSDRAGNDLLQIFTADLVFDGGRITGLVNERQLTSGADVNWAPYWHPDGRHIIYTTSRHGHANYELYLMRDDGSVATRVTHHASFDGLPVFSPDGKYLMWSSKRTSDNTTQIFIARFQMPSGA